MSIVLENEEIQTFFDNSDCCIKEIGSDNHINYLLITVLIMQHSALMVALVNLR